MLRPRNAPSLLVSVIAVLLLVACGAQPPAASVGQASFDVPTPLINEVLGSTTGADVEYVEIVGAADATLEGLSIIVVEGDTGSPIGAIDFRYDFTEAETICENGFFLIGNPLVSDAYGVTPDGSIDFNSIENSSYTIALVETASLGGESVIGGEVVLDAVAVTDGGAGDTFFFGAPVIGPDGSFLPAGVRRAVDAVDTDTAADWVIGDFGVGPANTPTAGGCTDGGGGGSEITPIHAIQGSGDASPLDGQTVTIEGIVVGDFQDNDDGDDDLNGFHVQEEDADADADPASSEGIFVYDGRNPAVDVAIGDLVRVTGVVDEYRGLTEITDVGVVEIVSSGNDLPTPATITLPASESVLEAAEGMSVVFPQQLQISEFFNYDRFGEIVLATPIDDLPRTFQPTSYDTVVETGLGLEATAEAIDARRITLDDGLTEQNPSFARHPNGLAFDLENRFRGGDLVEGATGVLDYSFGRYRIQPTAGATFIEANPRPDAPHFDALPTVAAFNVLNYFPTIDDGQDDCGPNFDQECRGADSAEEFERQEAKIVAAILDLDASVVGLMEIQNNAGAVGTLVDALNDAAGADVYAAAEDGTVGPDAIKVGLIYKPADVLHVGELAVLDTDDFLDPNDVGEPKNRAALAATFVSTENGGTFTVAVNHLKSKGSSCGDGDDDEFAGSCDLTRTLAAQRLADWLATSPTGIDDVDAMIVGDLNSYDEEDPIAALLDAGYVDLLERDEGEFTYTYVFDGQLGHLDYVMANATMAPQVVSAAAWHINTDEPDLIDYDTSFKSDEQAAVYAPDAYRSSDHDPVIAGLDMPTDPMGLVRLLFADVDRLESEGLLGHGNANALRAKLRAAMASLERGNANSARGQLGAFVNHLEAFVNSGRLGDADVALLIERAQMAIDALH